MRRNVVWSTILLVMAALAVPAAAAPAPGTGSIFGDVIDSTTGLPFDLIGSGGIIGVDVFKVDTRARTAQFLAGLAAAEYSFGSLPAGDYKLRFRYWDADSHLLRYRWYGDKGDLDTAATLHVIAGAALEADFTLKPMKGATVSGSLIEKGTGLPLATVCYTVHLYEASGIGMGFIFPVDEFGNWETFLKAPAGRWTALGIYNTGTIDPDGPGGPELPVDCGTSPAHLTTWYGGASGWPLSSGVLPHQMTFATADIFDVEAGSPVANIDIAMPAAPTCRGKVPTIFGTTLADTINGTAARDIISGLAGNDTINGLGGNDLLCGDAGNDTLTGGAGLKDTAVGGPGASDACYAETMIGCEALP